MGSREIKRQIRASQDQTETARTERHYHWAPRQFVRDYIKRYPTVRLFTQEEILDIRRTHGHRETESDLIGPPPHMEELKDLSKILWTAARMKAKELNKPWNDVRNDVHTAINSNISRMVAMDRRGLYHPDEEEIMAIVEIVQAVV